MRLSLGSASPAHQPRAKARTKGGGVGDRDADGIARELVCGGCREYRVRQISE